MEIVINFLPYYDVYPSETAYQTSKHVRRDLILPIRNWLDQPSQHAKAHIREDNVFARVRGG